MASRMDNTQIIYPVSRLLANPKIFIAVAKVLDGPDWETIAAAFYDLVELPVLEAENADEASFPDSEVCFRHKPEEPDVIQIVLDTGSAVELYPDQNEYYAAVKTQEELNLVSTIYGRLVRAIEEEVPEFTGDIALCEPPTPANEYLRDEEKDCFSGQFHLLSDPDQLFDFDIAIIDIAGDRLKATVKPVNA